MAAFNVLPFGNNCAANKKKNAIKTSNQCLCDVCVWPLEGATVVMIPTQKYTHKDNSSYKIQFYCQNSAHKTLQNDCKKKKKILVDNSSSHNWRFKPHQSANFKGMFPQKDTNGRLFY